MEDNTNYQCLNQRFDGIVDVLRTICHVRPAFDPACDDQSKFAKLEVKAIWDTGASASVITKDLADRLAITPIGMTKTAHANGESIVPQYLINIELLNNVGFPALRVTEGILLGFDVLLGMDVIRAGDFALTHHEQKTNLSFRVPSKCCIDFVQEVQAERVKQKMQSLIRKRPASNRKKRRKKQK